MTENKGKETPKGQTTEEDEVEGHSMMIDPTIAADVARLRTKELQREARELDRA